MNNVDYSLPGVISVLRCRTREEKKEKRREAVFAAPWVLVGHLLGACHPNESFADGQATFSLQLQGMNSGGDEGQGLSKY